ncbi:lysylphosphatidylglycerol synthase transmembrane domain-containing protein [Lysobacter firmicutimachus]|uniref:Lysylphosphatidylglycerol synthase transmembrane domain-containing protein n=1 Tax=Lysobacter firmicutimachus TaxID=1792846 RepID=A0AAU8MLB0_9GAMM
MFKHPWLRASLFFAALAGLFAYGWHNPQVVQRALAFGWGNVGVLALSYVAAQGLNAWILKAGLEPPYRGIGWSDAAGINMTSSLAGYLTPFRLGGMGSRLVILRLKYAVAPGYAVGQFLLVTLLTIGLSAVLFVAAVLIHGGDVLVRYRAPVWLMAAVAVGVALTCAALLHARSYAFLRSWLPPALVGVHEAMARPWRCQAKILLLLIAFFVLQVLQTQWLLHAVGLRGDWVFSILVCALANLMLVLSVTPANLGVKEALLGSLAFVFSVDEQAFIGALLVDRFVQLGVLALGTAAYAWSAGRDPGDT